MKLHSILIAFVLAFLPAALNAAAISDTATNTIVTGTATDRFSTNIGTNGVNETFILTTAPGAPTSPVATAGNASASVAFTAPASNGGSAITGYTVTSSPGGFTNAGATSPIVVSGLTNGTAYTFTVTATNVIGTGAASAASNSVTPATAPDAPTSPIATAGNASASVAFTAPASNGGSAITGYTVTSSPGGFTNAGATSPIVVSGLTNGTAYTFTVTATNVIGTGAASAVSNSVTPATAPDAPTSPVATAGNASASVAFTAPASNGGSAITGYTVTSSPGGFTNAGATSPIVVSGLTNGTAYTFTVTATNVIGTGAASAASNSVTPAAPVDIPLTFSGGALVVDASSATGPANITFKLFNDGTDDYMEISDQNRTLAAAVGMNQVNPNTVRVLVSSVTSLTINGSVNSDIFTLDFNSGGDFSPPGGIFVNGGLPGVGASPGDKLNIDVDGSGTYAPTGIGSGTVSLGLAGDIFFTGLEPLDFTGGTLVNFTVTIDPNSAFTGNVRTTVAAVDAGVNTNISFGASGLESVKLGAVTGSLTINGDDAEQDFIDLQGLGTAMTGDFTVDGKGGNADVIQVNSTTFEVSGLNMNLSLKADFIGIGRVTTNPSSPGVIRCSGNITLEANGDSSITTPPLWDPTTGVWGAQPAWFQTAAQNIRGGIYMAGNIEKVTGADATLTLKARAQVILPFVGASGYNNGGTIISTSGKLHTILNADSDATNGGPVLIQAYAGITTNGGDLTIGGGANPLTIPATGTASLGVAGVSIVGANVDTNGGNISLRGTGVNAFNGTGVVIQSSPLNADGTVTSGAGNVSIVGIGGGGSTCYGVRIFGDTSTPTPHNASVRSSTGNISITGTSAGGSNNGVILGVRTDVTASSTGNISLTGTGSGTGTNSMGVQLNAGTAPIPTSVSSGGGNVTLVADKMNLNGGTSTESITTTGSGSVTLKPLTAAVAINLGSTVDTTASTLELALTELGNVTAPTLAIGDSTSGSITISAVVSPAGFKTLALAQNTIFSAAGGFATDITSATDYEKIIVAGAVTIDASAALTTNVNGAYVPAAADSFTIIANDGTDAVSGTFIGLTEAASVNLNGTDKKFTYAGIDGNDVAWISASKTINVPPVVISAFTHKVSAGSPPFIKPSISDTVTFPSGPGTYSGPGFTAAIGSGDKIVMRFEAPANQKFIVRQPTGAQGAASFFVNAAWTTGAGDVLGAPNPTPIMTFENLAGPAPTNTYNLCDISDLGQAITLNQTYSSNGQFSFTALQIEFVVPAGLASAMRTYGAVSSSSAPSFGTRVNFTTTPTDQSVMSVASLYSPQELWRAANFSGTLTNTGSAANNADPDGDTYTNLLEYAFGTDPNNPASGPGEITFDAGAITLRAQPKLTVTNTATGVNFRAVFGRRKDYVDAGLTYKVQFSADMQTWQDGTATPTVLASDAEMDAVSVKYPFFLQDGRKAQYYRVEVSVP